MTEPTPVGAFRQRRPARPRELRALRRAVSEWLAASTDAGGTGADAVLIVSELFTNAVEAGATEVETTLYRSGRELRIVVTDDGPDWLPSPDEPIVPDPASLRGRGLALIARLGNLVVDRMHQRTRVMVSIDG